MYNNNKIVIFDWGGVIESHSDGEYNVNSAIMNIIKHFSSVEEIDITSIYKFYKRDEFGKEINQYNTIEDIRKWFNRLKIGFNFSDNCSFEEFCKVYLEEFAKVYYYKDVVSLAHSLKAYSKIGVLSNLGYLDKERINNQVNLKKFDYVWLSFDIGYSKPDEKIYEFVERDCKISPNNILFIDDSEENIITAKKRGWNVCLADGHKIDKMKESICGFLDLKTL